MKLQDFLKVVNLNDCNKKTRMIKLSHPLQWIDTEVKVPIWRVDFKYNTRSGKQKKKINYIIKEENMDFLELEHYFKNKIERYNEEHPYRALSNVEILDMSFIDGVILSLE